MFRARFRGQGYATGFGGYQPGIGSSAPRPASVASAAAAAAPNRFGAALIRNPQGPQQPSGGPNPPAPPINYPPPGTVLNDPGITPDVRGGTFIGVGGDGQPYVQLLDGRVVPVAPEVFTQWQSPTEPGGSLQTPPPPQTPPDTLGQAIPEPPTSIGYMPQGTPPGGEPPTSIGYMPQDMPQGGQPPTSTGYMPQGMPQGIGWMPPDMYRSYRTLPPDEFGQPQYQTPDGIVHVVDPQTGVELGRSSWPVANPEAPSSQWQPALTANELPGAGRMTPPPPTASPVPSPINDVAPSFYSTPTSLAAGGYQDYWSPPVGPALAPPPPPPPPPPAPIPSPSPTPQPSAYGTPYSDQSMPPVQQGTAPVAYTAQSVLGAPYTVTPLPQNPYDVSPLGDQSLPPGFQDTSMLGAPDPYNDPYNGAGTGPVLTA